MVDARKSDMRLAAREPALVRRMLAILRETQNWQRTTGQWQEIDRLIRATEHAFLTDDGTALRRSGDDLEMAGSLRITRIGSAVRQAAPPPVRERINRLVHALAAGLDQRPSRQ